MDRKVWIVTWGAYSSYSIGAVFDNEAEANRYADHLGRGGMDGADVEEYALHSSADRVTVTEVRILPNGTSSTHRWDQLEDIPTPEVRTATYSGAGDPDYPHHNFVEVRDTDPERAIKIARDTWARLKAEREGIA